MTHKDDLIKALTDLAKVAAKYEDEFRYLDIQTRLDDLLIEANKIVENEDGGSGEDLADILYQNKVGA